MWAEMSDEAYEAERSAAYEDEDDNVAKQSTTLWTRAQMDVLMDVVELLKPIGGPDKKAWGDVATEFERRSKSYWKKRTARQCYEKWTVNWPKEPSHVTGNPRLNNPKAQRIKDQWVRHSEIHGMITEMHGSSGGLAELDMGGSGSGSAAAASSSGSGSGRARSGGGGSSGKKTARDQSHWGGPLPGQDRRKKGWGDEPQEEEEMQEEDKELSPSQRGAMWPAAKGGSSAQMRGDPSQRQKSRDHDEEAVAFIKSLGTGSAAPAPAKDKDTVALEKKKAKADLKRARYEARTAMMASLASKASLVKTFAELPPEDRRRMEKELEECEEELEDSEDSEE
jgi:hypothetical protein